MSGNTNSSLSLQQQWSLMEIIHQNNSEDANKSAQLRVVAYPRVSKDEQNAPGKASIETQVKEMTDEALKRGWKIVYVANEDCEGWIEFHKRPEGSKIMQMANNGEFDILMLWDNDRLGRDVDGIVAKVARRDFRRRYIQIFSLHQPVEIKPRELYEPYNEDSSLWVENASDTASALFIRQFKRRHDMGMRKRIENGRITGTPPIGLKVIMVNDPLGSLIWRQKRVEDEEYSAVIRRIFDNYEQGLSYAEIAKQLNIDGIKTPPRYSKDGKPLVNGDRLWTSTTIKGIINNPVYYGASVYYKDKSISVWSEEKNCYVTVRKHQPMDKWLIVEKGEHPAIVTKEQWMRCQDIKNAKASFGRHYGESHLLSGLVAHGLCGYGMHKSGGWGGGYYVCNRYWKTGRTQCKPDSIRLVHLQKYVLEHIIVVSRNKKTLPHLKIQKDKQELEKLKKEKETYEGQLKKVIPQRAKIFEAFESGIYSKTLFKERMEDHEDRKKGLEKKIKEIESKINEIVKSEGVKKSALEVLDQFETKFFKLPLKHQKILIRQLIQKIEVKNKEIKIIFNI